MQTVEFRKLKIGERFRFASEFTMPHSGMKTGVAEKTSKQCYRYVEDDMECRVGSVRAETVRES